MKANELLLWLSAHREGSWQQFRAAVEELHSTEGDSESVGSGIPGEGDFPLYQQLRLNFERLGHAEFFAHGCEKGWRVAPPTLAAHPVSGGVRAVVCGARSPRLCERALKVDEKVECKIEVFNPYDVPQVIRFVAPNISVLQKVAVQVGAHFQADAPLAILSHLPLATHRPVASNKPKFQSVQIGIFVCSIPEISAGKRRIVNMSNLPSQVCSSSSFMAPRDTSCAGRAKHSIWSEPSRFMCSCTITGDCCFTMHKPARLVCQAHVALSDCSNVRLCFALVFLRPLIKPPHV